MRYGTPRIKYNAGAGDITLDFPRFAKGNVQLFNAIQGKTKRNYSGYPQADRLGKWVSVIVEYEWINEVNEYDWTELGISRHFEYYEWAAFLENHYEYARYFTFYPCWPSSNRPIHYPEYLIDCHAELPLKTDLSPMENTTGWHSMKFEFYGRRP